LYFSRFALVPITSQFFSRGGKTGAAMSNAMNFLIRHCVMTSENTKSRRRRLYFSRRQPFLISTWRKVDEKK
jgi:hypothetical protein